jgi:hypothetical protein
MDPAGTSFADVIEVPAAENRSSSEQLPAAIAAQGSITLTKTAAANLDARCMIPPVMDSPRSARGSSGAIALRSSAILRAQDSAASHIARSATVTGTRTARSAGASPPIKPMHSAQMMPTRASGAVTAR